MACEKQDQSRSGTTRPPLIVIFGVPGCGKTTLLRRLTSAWPVGRIWVFNPSGDPALDPCPRWDLDHRPPLRGVFLVADDFGLLMRPWEWQSPNPRCAWLREAILLHRHTHTTIALAAHRVTDIPPGMRDLATDVFAGQVRGHDQLRRLCLDWDPSLEACRDLPPHEFLHHKFSC